MPRGASPKREREFKKLEHGFKNEGRYKGRETEVAARIVNKQRAAYGETREEKAKDRRGQSPDRGLPIQDYQHLTVPQVLARLSRLSGQQVEKIRRYEQTHKHRKTLLEALARRAA